MLKVKLLNGDTGRAVYHTPSGERREIVYETRIDPLSGHVSKISEERAKRPMGVNVSCDIQPVEICDFCNYQNSTPRYPIIHECGAVSVSNMFPWEQKDWITLYPPFGKHKLLLSDIYFEDIERMMESSYDLADICEKDPTVLSFMDFTNWGPFAGASRQHPHSQRKSITHSLGPVLENELSHCKELAERYGENPFTMLLEEEQEDGARMIYNNDVFISAQFAPTTPGEILVFPKEEFSHVLQMGYEDRRRIIRPTLGIFPALFFYRGVTDLNIAIHMAPFRLMEEARKYYRWHMHIYPRRSALPVAQGGSEIGFGTSVIDTLPESVAESIREWYRGPRPELVVRLPDGSPNTRLLELFDKTVNNKH